MELLADNNLIKPPCLAGLMKEADEILAIVVTSKLRVFRGARISYIANRKFL